MLKIDSKINKFLQPARERRFIHDYTFNYVVRFSLSIAGLKIYNIVRKICFCREIYQINNAFKKK